MKSFEQVLTEVSVDKSPATVSTKKKVFSMYEDFLGGRTPTIENGEEFIQSKKGISPSTVNSYRMGLRTYFNHNDIEIPKNKFKSVKANNVREDKFVTPKEVDELYLIADNLRDKAVIRTLYHAGLRAKELIKLNVGDLDLKNHKINVRGVKKSHRVRVVRLILPEVVTPTLRAFLKRRGIDYNNPSSEDKKKPLLTTKNGKRRITYEIIRNTFRKLGGAIGKEDLSAHWLRHGYVVWCKKQGIPPEITARLIGDTVKTTVDIYSHYSQDDVDRVFAKLDGNLPELESKEKSPIDEIGELKEHNKALEGRIKKLENIVTKLFDEGLVDTEKFLKPS
jgi:integrase